MSYIEPAEIKYIFFSKYAFWIIYFPTNLSTEFQKREKGIERLITAVKKTECLPSAIALEMIKENSTRFVMLITEAHHHCEEDPFQSFKIAWMNAVYLA